MNPAANHKFDIAVQSLAWMPEAGRHHADDCVGVLIDPNPAADHLWVAPKLALP